MMKPLRSFLLPCLAGLLIGTGPLSAASDVRVTKTTAPGSNKQFLADLAEAERKHDYASLLAACDRQIAAHPDSHEAYRRRALARWGARRYNDALTDFDEAARLAKAHRVPQRILTIMYYDRALIQREQRDTAAEAVELERAVKADPGFTDSYNDLAWIRATNPEAGLRDGRQAVRLAKHACEVVPTSVKYLDTLAAAYAEAGEAKNAADSERAAIKAARADALTAGAHKDFLAEAEGRVEFYAGGGKYRENAGKPVAEAR